MTRLQQRGGKLFVFGGFVRDSIHGFVHKQQVSPRDVDLVVSFDDQQQGSPRDVDLVADGVLDIGSVGEKNNFGGVKWQAEGGLRIDCWTLKSTLAFRERLITPATLENLPRTTVYRLNGCYLALEDGSFHGEEAIADVFARRIAFNCKSYRDEHPEYQAFRAVDLSQRLDYELDDEVKEFIAQSLSRSGAARFIEQVRLHRKDLDAASLQARFDQYVKI